jgi:hypothetical protein
VRAGRLANVWQKRAIFAKHWQNACIARRMPRVLNFSLFSRHFSLRGGFAAAHRRLPPRPENGMMPRQTEAPRRAR